MSAWRPNELEDIRAAFVLLVRNLGVSAPALDREFQARKRWIYLHGPFNATQVQPLRQVNGVHLTRGVSSASIPRATWRGRSSAGSRPTGRSGARGSRGRSTRCSPAAPGEAVLLKDQRGPPLRLARPEDARPGGRVTTSPSRSTPSCRRSPSAGSTTPSPRCTPRAATWSSSTRTRASCWRWPPGRRRAAGCPAHRRFTDPFEPGSTAKLFTAAALLMRGRVKPADAVSGENGAWNMPMTSTRADPSDHRRARPARHAHAGARHPGLEQHRHGEVLLAPPARGAVRDAARLRLRHADRRGVSRASPAGSWRFRIAGSRCTPAPAWRWATSSR